MTNNKIVSWQTIIYWLGYQNALEFRTYKDLFYHKYINYDIKIVHQDEWIGIDLSDLMTNGFTPNQTTFNIPINPKFANIETLADLNSALCKYNEDDEDWYWLINSPSRCYFETHDDQTFYHGQQGGSWCYEERTNRIYIVNEDQPHTTFYVAHNLPKFLSRIYLENKCWYDKGNLTEKERLYLLS